MLWLYFCGALMFVHLYMKLVGCPSHVHYLSVLCTAFAYRAGMGDLIARSLKMDVQSHHSAKSEPLDSEL